ncbi:hypothetical protein WJX84_011905 [Apatococcus fuscideae]|uniref:Heme oxygenase n=1 Tax=Apatococcus fuscideae TaxID=2026836 RepID=A0AAW1SHP9_9CHLO
MAPSVLDGSYDYVKVRDWGPGQPADLGSLQVESFAPGDDPADDAKPLADVLARRLEWLQAQGMLTRADDSGGGGEVLPFQQWSFSERSYVQYLTDLLGVHHVLEQALSEGTVVHGPDHYGDVGDGKGVWTALELLSPRQGLARSEEIHRDLNNIAKSSNSTDTVRFQIAEPAKSYAGYLAECGRGMIGPSSPDQHATSALRILANAYCIYISHLGSAMRVGALATEKLGLAPVDAINLYQTYGGAAGPDPLKSLLRNVNSAGLALSTDQRRVVIRELPEAMSYCALLLTSLATND